MFGFDLGFNYSLIAVGMLAFFLWLAKRGNDEDRQEYDNFPLSDVEKTNHLLLHIRQDLKSACFLLGALIVMLGIIADRAFR